MDEQIGWLAGSTAVCTPCRPQSIGVPLYAVNVRPYHQTCNLCGTVLHQGALGWPVLFDGKPWNGEAK